MCSTKRRCNVYIDGFNWYHAIFKHYPDWKWLDIQKFFEALRPHEDVLEVKFFTAIIDPDDRGSDARERHEKYVAVLSSCRKIRVILGKFQNRDVTCRAECKQRYSVPEEKKTDVNICVELMSDAIDDKADVFVVVSGDSDLQPPVEWVQKRYGEKKKVVVYVPALPNEQQKRRLDFYRQLGIDCQFLPLDSIKNCQFPNKMKVGSNFHIRPHSWSVGLPGTH